MIVRRYIVKGRVQGVFYRASTAREALRLGVCGHARNLADGSVEVLAGGEAAVLDEFEKWLWRGPGAARVTAVELQADAGTLATQMQSGRFVTS
ncbi:MAG: acylphosphatase [Steroidobacteraceae bacterium]